MRKIAKFVVTILLCATCFLSGCNLLTVNNDRYINRVVGQIGNTTVSKQDLIYAFNSNGANYQSQGYKDADTLELLIRGLLNNQLLTEYAKNLYTSTEEGGFGYAELKYDEIENNTNIEHYNDVLENVYASVNSQILSIENLIRAEQGLPIVEEKEAEQAAEKPQEARPYTPYEKKVERRWNSETKAYDYVLIEEDEQEPETEVIEFVQDIHGNQAVANQAWARYIKTLKNSEAGKNLDVIENNIFKREIERLFDIYADQKYLQWFEEVYQDNIRVDNSLIVDKYIELVEDSRAKYQSDYDAYVSAMQSDNGSVYYHPFAEDKSFVYVSHVLIKYTDEQIEQIKQWQKDLADGTIIQEQYDEFYENLKLTVGTKARNEEGEEYGDFVTLADISSEINSALEACGNDVEKRAEAFNKFIYKYGQDGGINNATNYYVVNMDTNKTDTMVKNFADESRRLYLEEGAGSVSKPIFVESSNYSGFHIIFCAGLAQNLVPYTSLRSVTADKLFDTRIMLGAEKSYYDAMYDLVTTDAYSSYQTSLVRQLQNGRDIILYVNAYKDLITDGSVPNTTNK